MKFFATVGLFLLAAVIVLPGTAEALTLSPVREEITADPGETVHGELLLINEQEGTKTFYSTFGNFEASGESGTPSFVEGREGLATWIEAVSSVTLSQNEQLEVPYTIRIPKNAAPGGHFAAIFWSTVPPRSQSEGVSIGAKVGSLILLRVSGEIPEGGGVLEFTTKGKQGFFSSLPIALEYRFQNGGGDRLKPEGTIRITNLIGFTSATFNANPDDGNILPQSVRKFDVLWEKGKDETKKLQGEGEKTGGFFGGLKQEWSNIAFGRYTAHLDVVYGAEGERAQASTSFFVVPWRILSILIVILAILSFLFSLGIKRYNKWVTQKAISQFQMMNAGRTAPSKAISTVAQASKKRRLKTL
ncbi:MAG: hypothetical protein Q8Q38_00675 [bacterium]|nr:hypothetical protein [bacterium]